MGISVEFASRKDAQTSEDVEIVHIEHKIDRKLTKFETLEQLGWRLFLGVIFWMALWLVFGDIMLPTGKNLVLEWKTGCVFTLLLLVIAGYICGVLLSRLGKAINLPPLLGMLLAGFLGQNLPGNLLFALEPTWSSTLRAVSLFFSLTFDMFCLNLAPKYKEFNTLTTRGKKQLQKNKKKKNNLVLLNFNPFIYIFIF